MNTPLDNIKKPVFTISLVIVTGILSLIGYAGKYTAYSEYEMERGDQPYIANFFMALHDGVTPLDVIASIPAAISKGGSHRASSDDGTKGDMDGLSDADTTDSYDDTASNAVLNDADSEIEYLYNESGISEAAASPVKADDGSEPSYLPGTSVDLADYAAGSAKKPGIAADDSDGTSHSYADDMVEPGQEGDAYSGDALYRPEEFDSFRQDSATHKTIEYRTDDSDISVFKTISTRAPKGFSKVDDSYLSDALFIGDSRVVGLAEYSGVDSTFYSSTGISVFKLFSKSFCETPQGKTDLETALRNNRFSKIYLQVGINEIGTGDTDYYLNGYREAVDRIRSLQPDAIIFIQGIIRVSQKKENNVFSNVRINERNEALKTLCDDKNVFYLEVNDALCDDNGYLNSEYSFDGVHLYAKYYSLWIDYILEHGIV